MLMKTPSNQTNRRPTFGNLSPFTAACLPWMFLERQSFSLNLETHFLPPWISMTSADNSKKFADFSSFTMFLSVNDSWGVGWACWPRTLSCCFFLPFFVSNFFFTFSWGGDRTGQASFSSLVGFGWLQEAVPFYEEHFSSEHPFDLSNSSKP